VRMCVFVCAGVSGVVCDACVYCSAMHFFSISSKEIAPPPTFISLKFESGTSSSDSVLGATSFRYYTTSTRTQSTRKYLLSIC